MRACWDIQKRFAGVGVLDDPLGKFDLHGQIFPHGTELPPYGGRDVGDAIPYDCDSVRANALKRLLGEPILPEDPGDHLLEEFPQEHI